MRHTCEVRIPPAHDPKGERTPHEGYVPCGKPAVDYIDHPNNRNWFCAEHWDRYVRN